MPESAEAGGRACARSTVSEHTVYCIVVQHQQDARNTIRTDYSTVELQDGGPGTLESTCTAEG
eukprot:1992004-Prymnesium_polylepis.1